MTSENIKQIEAAKVAATKVLLHNSKGPFQGLPRTAGWGYPEPYTRDLLISVLGIAVTRNAELIQSIQNVLLTLAKNQSRNGQIPSLVHDKDNRGASDTTPLFLMATGIYRIITEAPLFLEDAVQKSLLWMEYQSPTNRYLVAQQPTSDWRDEQWVPGYGLFVNTLVFIYLHLLGDKNRAQNQSLAMSRLTYASNKSDDRGDEGLAIKNKPYYALWSYKVYSSERFDLLGNSLAVLSGLATSSKANAMVHWIEKECSMMKKNGELSVDLAPNFFPYIKPDQADWLPRYAEFNNPGDYHNGGIWPFISGLHIAALTATKQYDLAVTKLTELTRLIKIARNNELEFGFNEWYKAQTGEPMGQDWQTWSASNYLYAAHCVQHKNTPFFEEMRQTAYKSHS